MSTHPNPSYPGSRWWKFDFHTHTPASSDYGAGGNQTVLKARSPREWIMSFLEAGIHCVAVTDHHTGNWIDPLKAALAEMRIEGISGASDFHLFPGVELSINGTHYLAIFGPEKSTQTISDLLVLARYDGNEVNAQGHCLETNATTICREVERLGGLFMPAHVDLESTGLFRQTQEGILRPLFNCESIIAMEVAGVGFEPPALYRDSRIRWSSVLGSDSHHPTAHADGGGRFPGSHFTWVKIGTPSLEALKLALHDGNEFALIRSDAQDAGYNPNGTPENWIESLEISDARWMGRGTATRIEFSPWMNAVIGGRGSGKSTLIQFIRLATRREEALSRLGVDNRVLKNLTSFEKVGEHRGDEGGLLAGTKAVLVYRKAGERFRLNWLQSDHGTTVESYDAATDQWVPASSQDVVSRFPLGIFSQDEIGLIAENPGALLHQVDETIGKKDWDARWENEVNTFLALLGKIRSQRSRLAEQERLTGELDDVVKKLAVLERSEHATLFKAARKVRRQSDQMKSLFGAYDRIVGEIGSLQKNLLLHDLPDDLLDPDRAEDAGPVRAEGKLRGAVERAARILEKVHMSMIHIAEVEKQVLARSAWETAHQVTEEGYRALMEALEKRGLGDPAKFSQVAARRQTLEKSLKEIEAVDQEIKQLRQEATASQKRLLDLRSELQRLRRAFLNRELQNNRYVKIELNAFGSEDDKDRVEAELRRILGCEDSRFADALRHPERSSGGFVETLYAPADQAEDVRVVSLLKRIADWKQEAVNAGNDKPSGLPGAFQNFLKRELARRPEYFDRLHAWWPEDSLAVSYSKGGLGRDFVSLRNGSAGEKAAALLAFFLAHGSSPLVIDQPENDLDNHLITDLVVKQLRENKARRQVIVVTHNPNIVVNGDAEMVHAMRFENGQCRAKAPGPLQEPLVRSEVCEIMEGGKPALTSRYQRLI